MVKNVTADFSIATKPKVISFDDKVISIQFQ